MPRPIEIFYTINYVQTFRSAEPYSQVEIMIFFCRKNNARKAWKKLQGSKDLGTRM